MQAAGGIDHHRIKSGLLRIGHALTHGFQRIRLHAFREHFRIDLFAERLQLLNGGRTHNVGGDQQTAPAVLALQDAGDLGGAGGLAGSLQADHHDDGDALFLELQAGVLVAEQIDDLVVHDLDEHLSRLHAGEDILAERFLAHGIQEFLDDPVIDIRFQKRKPHFLQHVLHVLFSQLALACDIAHRFGQPLAQ